MNVAIPPRSRNHRLPAACDAPTASAASSLLKPSETLRQNSRSTSRRNDGLPGDFIGDRPVNSVIHPAGLPIATPLDQALQRPVESAQYTSFAVGQTLDDHGVLASIGSVGDAYDNALAESFVDTFKTELITDRVWRTLTQMELAIVEYVSWFNHDRLHGALGDIPPVEFEAAHADPTVGAALRSPFGLAPPSTTDGPLATLPTRPPKHT
jgi:hypothetical protein